MHTRAFSIWQRVSSSRGGSAVANTGEAEEGRERCLRQRDVLEMPQRQVKPMIIIHTVPISSWLTFGLPPSGVLPSGVSGAVTGS